MIFNKIFFIIMFTMMICFGVYETEVRGAIASFHLVSSLDEKWAQFIMSIIMTIAVLAIGACKSPNSQAFGGLFVGFLTITTAYAAGMCDKELWVSYWMFTLIAAVVGCFDAFYPFVKKQ